MPKGYFNHKGRPGKLGGSLPRNNLSSLFSILKGGPGSGNKGHAGIPGHRGGSAPKNLVSKSVFIDEDIEYPIGDKFSNLISEASEAYPKEILGYISKVYVGGTTEDLEEAAIKEGRTAEDLENFGGAAGVFFKSTKALGVTTALRSKDDIVHILDHEVGHAIWTKAEENRGSGVGGYNMLYEVKPDFGRHNEQARKNVEESFSETYNLYLRDRGKLSRDEINGVEYILEDIGHYVD